MTKIKQLKVTLVKSLSKCLPKHRACVLGLGLSKRINRSVIVNDDPCIRGMINKASYLLSIEEV